MEYQLLSDPQNKVRLIMSMGHEAMAAWFNTEVVDDERLLQQISAGIALLKATQQQWQHEGKEYSIWITDDTVTVKANYLWQDAELPPEEDMNFYDAEAQCCCGVEDFCHLMQAWRQFANTGT